MHFRVLVADTSRYDFPHPDLFDGDYEKGFYNLYRQLLLNGLDYGDLYHVRLAKRNIKKASATDCEQARLFSLLEKVNCLFIRRLTKHGTQPTTPPILSIEARPARERRLIQLSDILMGTVGTTGMLNTLRMTRSSWENCASNYISNHMGPKDLLSTTS